MWRHCSKKIKSRLCWRNTTSGKLGGCLLNEQDPEEGTLLRLGKDFDLSKHPGGRPAALRPALATACPAFRPLSSGRLRPGLFHFTAANEVSTVDGAEAE
jgi:hypothetical protein